MTLTLTELNKFFANLEKKFESNTTDSPEYFITGLASRMQREMPGNYMLKFDEDDEGKLRITIHFFTEQDELMFILKYS
jgi:hypothetical protein